MNVLLLVLALVTVDVRLGPKQRQVVEAVTRPTHRFVDVEGALRSAKTWSVLIGIRQVLQEYPGIVWTMARWNKGDLDQKLVPDWRNVCELTRQDAGVWNAKERCFDFGNRSRLYAIHGKTNANENKYAHVRGLTTAGVFINQLEEWPEDVFDEFALRLSQPGYPQVLIADPNPVPKTHWIAKKFPADNSDPDHRYLTLSIWDNKLLSPDTVRAAERLYPVGHPKRPVKLEGRRGLDISGTPVYSGAFGRGRHVRQLSLHPDLPLCEAYDYGFHHPCVLWYQVAPWGWVRILGGVMGVDLHLDAFLPIVEKYRQEWFPGVDRIEATCDPAGANENSQGLRGTPVGILRAWYQRHGVRDAHGDFVVPIFRKDANAPERRHAANELAATYMRRRANGDEAFIVDRERWRLVSVDDDRFDDWFVEGLEIGYVLEDQARHSDRLGTYWVAKKDGWFEHGQNCLEYGVQAHVYDLPEPDADRAKLVETEATARAEREREQRASRSLKAKQQDRDEDDQDLTVSARRRGRRTASRASSRRGGY